MAVQNLPHALSGDAVSLGDDGFWFAIADRFDFPGLGRRYLPPPAVIDRANTF
jgi:hypothetical protein